jgi:hypothetical protein
MYQKKRSQAYIILPEDTPIAASKFKSLRESPPTHPSIGWRGKTPLGLNKTLKCQAYKTFPDKIPHDECLL